MAKGNAKLLTMGPSRSDIALLFLLLLFTLYLEKSASPYERPVDLKDPSLQLPHKHDVIPSLYLVIFSLLGPLFVFCVFEFPGLRSKRALLLLFFTALFEANLLAVLVTNILKLIIGRPRPYFASVCVEYVSGSDTQCTGDPHSVSEARKSFPSGHSSLAFSAAVFLACYLATKFGMGKATSSARTWKICTVLTPPFAAALVAASRTVDNHHHYADVLAGSVLGAAIALTVFQGRSPAMNKLAEMEESAELITDAGGYESITGEDGV